MLIAATFLFLQGCENREEHIFQLTRCGLAAGLDVHSDPSVVTLSAEAVGLYGREHGIKMSFEEMTVITDKITKEIMGAPESPVQEWDDRAKKIAESDFCKKYLSSLYSK